jgi:hypothetical protein
LQDLEELLDLISRGATGMQPAIGTRLERDLDPELQGLRAFESPFDNPVVDLFDEPDDSADLLGDKPWLKESFIDVKTQDQKRASAQGVDPWAIAQNQPSSSKVFKGWMQKYDNGKIPSSALTPVAGGQFRSDAASAWKAMARSARKDGVNISLTDSYRSYAGQVDVYNRKPGLAARPGTSVHGWGLAADVGAGREWIQKNGSKFGWIWPDWARPGGSKPEPWHFEFEGWEGAVTSNVKKTDVKRDKRKPKPGKLPTNLVNPASPMVVLPMAFDATMHEAFVEAEPKKRESTPQPGKMGKGVKAQLRAGFRSVGRNDLARFVDHPDFQTWIQQESGWNPRAVSPANNQGKANGGLFQFWFGHAWAAPYNKNGKFTMSVYDQAINAVKHFGLTVGEIKRYANSIRAGSYKGWG